MEKLRLGHTGFSVPVTELDISAQCYVYFDASANPDCLIVWLVVTDLK